MKRVCSRCNGTKVDPDMPDCRCDCCDENGMEGEDDPPRAPSLCAYPTGCRRKRLRGLSFCRKHQPYPAGGTRR